MAKISQASSKYIIRATIEIDGVVDRPDVVGAIFGQIEGLLGADLELRELQRSGRIGRIEVDVKSKDGKTTGTIVIPSSLDKAETAIVGGALEIIERIGPCNARISVKEIEDERANKRQQVINRAKQLLKNLQDSQLPDSQELSDEVSSGIRIMEITQYGKDKLPASPGIEEAKDVIFVEGRADVINLLKHGFTDVISINGTNVPSSIKKLSKEKNVTVLCDGDRGGDLIIKELLSTCEIDYITKAPDGKEVEELQKKEIHQALRSKVKASEWDSKSKGRGRRGSNKSSSRSNSKGRSSSKSSSRSNSRSSSKSSSRSNSRSSKPPKASMSSQQKKKYGEVLKGMRAKTKAIILNDSGAVLGQIAFKDFSSTLPALPEAKVVITRGKITKAAAEAIDSANIRHVVAEDATGMRTALVKVDEFN